MKKVWIILIAFAILVVVVWLGYAGKTPKLQTVKTQTEEKTVVTMTAEEDLNKELGTTADDGGAADFVELQKSAEGL